ncbi:MAG: metallophosphatase domain-containing protein [Planctomycetota bacterium]
MRIVCLADTHSRHDRVRVPAGDLLLHAGDLTKLGSASEITVFDQWLGTLPHRHKVIIAGNHDFLFEREPERARALIKNAIYLEDRAITLDGLTIFGTPWQPEFFHWAFNLPRGEPLARKWAAIPDGVDVLMTHGPPHGIQDRVQDGELVGCADLRAALARVRPRLHVFGHIHEAYGQQLQDGTTFVNAAICDLGYAPVHAPIVITL